MITCCLGHEYRCFVLDIVMRNFFEFDAKVTFFRVPLIISLRM
jgi:hypothetical protein